MVQIPEYVLLVALNVETRTNTHLATSLLQLVLGGMLKPPIRHQ